MIEDLPLTPSVLTSQNVCIDEDIVLESEVVPAGNNVMYHWYSGLPPEGQLMETTTVPQYTIAAPHSSGTGNFYLILEASGCVSPPSTAVSIIASQRPQAVVVQEQITICEGESIELGTEVTGTDIEYQWTGPDGYASSAQLPAAIENADLNNRGVYTLVVSRNGCESPPDFTTVNVLPKPATPSISDNGPLCTGETLSLVSDNNEAAVYHWIAPDLQQFSTTSNLFEVTDVDESVEGFWRVSVTQFGCDSEPSSSTKIDVNPVPDAIASAQRTEICGGDELRLLGVPNINGASYLWRGPQGYSSSSANPVISEIADNQGGTYELFITTLEGCTDSAEVDISVLNGVTITAVSNDGTTCLNGPTDIQLVSTVFPADDGTYEYNWTGPLGYSSSDEVALIPNATAANNGNYQLVVINENDCVSNALTTVVDVTDPPSTPPAPALSSSTPVPLCANERVILEVPAYGGNSVTYNWSTPNGDVVTEVPSLTFNNAAIGESGVYAVFVNVDGCTSKTSGNFVMEINEVPQIEVNGNGPVCSGAEIRLEATLLPNATYEWLGPSDFTSSRANPLIGMADSSRHTGTYTVAATLDGCISEAGEIEVRVLPTPPPPIVDNSSPICISTPGEILVLSVDSSGAFPDAFYSWFDDTGQVGAEVAALNFGLKDYQNYGPGTFEFRARARFGACISEFSRPTEVVFDIIPDNNAFAGVDEEVCAESMIELKAEEPSAGQGLWTLIAGDSAGVVIANPGLPTTAVEGLQAGRDYLFQWTISNGACQGYSSDEVLFNVERAELPLAGEDQLVCDEDTVQLAAVPPMTVAGRWVQEASQEQFGVTIEDPLDPESTVSGLEPGNVYTFLWTINSSCGEFEDKVFVRVSDPGPFAGFDKEVCNDDAEVTLEADTPLGGEATWSSITPGVAFSDENRPDAIATGIREGENIFVWTIDGAVCGATSRDTVVIEYFMNPRAMDDEIEVPFGKALQIDLLENDFLPKEVEVNILSAPGFGTLEVVDTGVYLYTPGVNFVGADVLTYELCSGGCECSVATVRFGVGNDVECKVPTIITPNNDGINDAFVVPCLLNVTAYPQSQVIIFNQWGDEVYRSGIPYKNDWQGTFSGEDLPVGTYFYIIEYGTGRPRDNGYLVIHR